ncbi:ABC transporter G family member 9-like [Benincasa hispida]|uniref:ABC transporter G family member 9-like n=1 Tax=Benincasa hispida TaxID=102211 RepID=UPI0019009DF3|nr:ABC transporter G family member 9-like [Benincasa hispida]
MADIEAQTNKKMESDRLEATAFSTKANHPVTWRFNDIHYKIKSKQTSFLIPKKEKLDERTILKGLSGVVSPGEMLVMLGPSGSGKTTLLIALSGRINGHLDGAITYNGKPFSSEMKRRIGFVTQDDILHPHLTIVETLAFTALLRLPNTLTKQEKLAEVEVMISLLGLSKCKNTIVGSQTLRGVSGGERKRVSIGQEILVNPSLLFLDEPTSGLDSTTTQMILTMMGEFAKGGRTVVMTVHQPSSRLFYLFHKLLLLLEGNAVYFGKGSEVMDYFSSIRYSPSVPMNPSDFLLDLINGLSMNDPNEDPTIVKQKLVSSYKNNISEKLKSERQESDDEHWCKDGSYEDSNFEIWPTTWCQQFCVLLRREIKERRYESFSAMRVVQVLLIAFLCGFLWWQSDDSHLQDKLGLLYSIQNFWAFLPVLKAISTFSREQKILEKERSSGMYRLSSYFMSKSANDLPMELALPTIFTLIVYWMTGLKPTLPHFLATLFTILLNVLAFQGFGFALGALIMDQTAATILGSVLALAFVLTSGFFVQNVPQFFAWIKYLSIGHFTYKLLLISQFKADDTYPCPKFGGLCKVGEFPNIKQIGLEGKATTVLALVVMLVGYRLIAYIALLRIGVTKKN